MFEVETEIKQLLLVHLTVVYQFVDVFPLLIFKNGESFVKEFRKKMKFIVEGDGRKWKLKEVL
jgi:hypothetical protein